MQYYNVAERTEVPEPIYSFNLCVLLEILMIHWTEDKHRLIDACICVPLPRSRQILMHKDHVLFH
jgi:hypothetical protein